MHGIALSVRGCAAHSWSMTEYCTEPARSLATPRACMCLDSFPYKTSRHRHCHSIPRVPTISEQQLHFMVLQRKASRNPTHLDDIIPRVEAQRREGLNAGGQLAVLKGGQAAAQIGCQRAQAAALRMVPPRLVARQHQGYTLQKITVIHEMHKQRADYFLVDDRLRRDFQYMLGLDHSS